MKIAKFETMQQAILPTYSMKRTILLFAALFTCRTISAQNYDNGNNWHRWNLNGKVKTMKQTPYMAIDNAGVITKGKIAYNGLVLGICLWQIDTTNLSVEFNWGGEVTTINYYNDTKPAKEYMYEYDSAGRLVTEFSPPFNSMNRFDRKAVYVYNDMRKWAEKDVYLLTDTTIPLEVTRYTYNNSGILTSMDHDSPKGQLYLRTKYYHDSLGEITKFITIRVGRGYGAGQFQKMGTYVYGVFDKIVETAEYKSEDERNWERRSEYQYDSLGNERQEDDYFYNNGGNLPSTTEWEYDSYDNVIKKTYLSWESKISAKQYVRPDVTTYQYQYDDHGNWIKRIDYHNGKPGEITERQIIYY